MGIRTIKFDAKKGFFLNGKHIKIKGTNNHQDHAGIGSALPDYLQYYRIKKLKEFGSNAYRASHNAPTPELLKACDSLGMLVLNEHRLLNSSPEYVDQLERLILRWVLKIAFFTFDLKKSQKPFHDLLKSAQIYYYF